MSVAVFVSMAVIRDRLAAVLRKHARRVFELDRAVVYPEASQYLVNAFQDPFARRRRHIVDQNM